MTAESLQTNQTVNEANTQANESNQHEHQNQRILSDRADILTDPTHCSGDDSTNITNKSTHSGSSSRPYSSLHF